MEVNFQRTRSFASIYSSSFSLVTASRGHPNIGALDNLDTPIQISFDAALRLQSCLLTVEFTEFSSLGLYHLALCEAQDTRGYYAVLSGSSSFSSTNLSKQVSTALAVQHCQVPTDCNPQTSIIGPIGD